MRETAGKEKKEGREQGQCEEESRGNVRETAGKKKDGREQGQCEGDRRGNVRETAGKEKKEGRRKRAGPM